DLPEATGPSRQSHADRGPGSCHDRRELEDLLFGAVGLPKEERPPLERNADAKREADRHRTQRSPRKPSPSRYSRERCGFAPGHVEAVARRGHRSEIEPGACQRADIACMNEKRAGRKSEIGHAKCRASAWTFVDVARKPRRRMNLPADAAGCEPQR